MRYVVIAYWCDSSSEPEILASYDTRGEAQWLIDTIEKASYKQLTLKFCEDKRTVDNDDTR